jgi:hypothetical protein
VAAVAFKDSKACKEVVEVAVAFKDSKASKAPQHRRISLRDFKKTRSVLIIFGYFYGSRSAFT